MREKRGGGDRERVSRGREERTYGLQSDVAAIGEAHCDIAFYLFSHHLD